MHLVKVLFSAFLLYFVGPSFGVAQGRHPERRGLLASPALDGQPVKGVYFFAGEGNAGSPIYTTHPTNADDLHWNSQPATRARVLDRMVAAHVNTLVMSYWSNMPQWSPMQLDGTSLAGVLDASQNRPLVIMPAIEGGFDSSHPEIPHWQFSADFPHPAGSSAIAPGLVDRIGLLVSLFQGRMKLWAQIYDRNGDARYAVNILHVCSDQRTSDTEFAAAFDLAAAQVLAKYHVLIGFTLDTIGGNQAYVASPGKAGPVLASKASVLAIMGFESEVFSGKIQPGDNNKSNLPGLADWKGAALRDWLATGVPVIFDVSNGFDGRFVWKSAQNPNPGFWGDNLNYSDDRWRNWMSELKSPGIKGIVMDTWNGYTEGYAAVPSREHASIVYNWLTDLLEPDPRVCSHMQYANGQATFRVFGAICDKWVQLGGDRAFGPPAANEAASAHGRVSKFADGKAIYWSGPTGAHEVHGLIAKAYFGAGADGSCLGLPTSDEQANGGGRIGHFEHGTITWNPGETAAHINCR